MKTGDKYVAMRDARYMTARSSFEINTGHVVTIQQVDRDTQKVLVDFGDGDMDWFSNHIIQRSFKKC